eukprot:1138079-Pelagomonas_calceolata.AAC.1
MEIESGNFAPALSHEKDIGSPPCHSSKSNCFITKRTLAPRLALARNLIGGWRALFSTKVLEVPDGAHMPN